MEEYLLAAVKALNDKFGGDTVALDIRGLSAMADYFIITDGTNPNQMRAMVDETVMQLEKAGINLQHSEGMDSEWVLLDFGDLIIHIFKKESRQFYKLEKVWGDAKVLSVPTN